MAAKITALRGRATEIARHPRTRKIAIWLVAIFAFFVILALAAPPLLKNKVAAELSTKLHRPISIEQIRFNPFTMSLTVRGFLMKERQGSATAVSFDELYANLELRSLFRWAPVLKEIRLVKPYFNVVRNEDRTYNFTDLIDEFSKGPPEPKGPPTSTPRFALNNIQVLDGKIDFDDRPEQTKHSITAIKIGVPFISSIPSQVDIKVQPEFRSEYPGPRRKNRLRRPAGADKALHHSYKNRRAVYLQHSFSGGYQGAAGILCLGKWSSLSDRR